MIPRTSVAIWNSPRSSGIDDADMVEDGGTSAASSKRRVHVSQRATRSYFVLVTVAVFVVSLAPVACRSTVEPKPEADAGWESPTATREIQSSPNPSAGTPAASVRRVRLSEMGHRPTGLSGSLSVGIGLDWQVHLVNVITGERRQLTGGLDRKREAVISDSHVAWTAQNRFREVLSNFPVVRRSYHIFVMDVQTGATRRITSGTAMRRNLQIGGNQLVWEESRSMNGDSYTDYNVYAYDTKLDETIPVAVAPGSQRYPAIDRDRVVWIDDRNCTGTKKGSRSTRSCLDGLLDVYLYDFATGEERPVAKSTASAYHAPGIHGDHVVWRAHDGRYSENTSLHLHSLANGRTRTIVSLKQGNIGTPAVSADYVAWTVREPCDVVWTPPQEIGTGAFTYSIEYGTTEQLSQFAEPDVLLDGKTALVHEGCWLPGPVYSVILD